MESMTTEKKPSAGELLKQGRLRQRLSIVECAKRTHIATRYLEALEEDRWQSLPSESHRLGFLRLYSRFLGVPAEEVLALYHQKRAETLTAPPPAPQKSESSKPAAAPRWSAPSWPQLIGLSILFLISAWLIYHSVRRHTFDQNPIAWIRLRPAQYSRLGAPKPGLSSQRIHVKAQADSWLRIMANGQLLFEGILPAGGSKEWSGAGPFQLKIGNVRALELYWNDQPVDLVAGARGGMNELQIPPR